VAAVVRREDGRFLLASRPEGSHMAGLWEFPGGAIEPGETPEEALRREMMEELNVSVRVEGPITFAFHRDDERDVLILFYRARITAGEVTAVLAQRVGWFEARELGRLQTPPADAELIAMLVAETA
jgi:8-oxo-dGTP diphosphatase